MGDGNMCDSKKSKKTMKVGIPRALLYFKYAQLWETFFYSLDVEYIISPDTNSEILTRGINIAVDETCLPSKIFLGHVDWLIDKCDCILIPRIASTGKNSMVCTKYQAVYDVARNTFRDRDINILLYNIEKNNLESEVSAFIKIGTQLGKKKSQSIIAYWNAKQAQKAYNIVAVKEQQSLLKTNKTKILIIAHQYNLYDKYIGAPIIDILKNMDVVPINGCVIDEKTAIQKSALLSDTLPWVLSQELLGSIAEYRDYVDGIILLSSFPCGPDSMVNEIIIRRVKDKPILNLVLDGQEASAGIETRLESFMDIINYRKGISDE